MKTVGLGLDADNPGITQLACVDYKSTLHEPIGTSGAYKGHDARRRKVIYTGV